MILLQIGEAPETPEATDFIRVLSLLPTQTPTITPGVQPTAQLSLWSSVVPVFTATERLLIFNKLLAPKVINRALLSAKILLINHASSSDKTLCLDTALYSSKIFPWASSTLRMLTGSTFSPELAKAL